MSLYPQDKKFVEKVGTKSYGTSAKNTISNRAFKITGWTGTTQIHVEVQQSFGIKSN